MSGANVTWQVWNLSEPADRWGWRSPIYESEEHNQGVDGAISAAAKALQPGEYTLLIRSWGQVAVQRVVLKAQGIEVVASTRVRDAAEITS